MPPIKNRIVLVPLLFLLFSILFSANMAVAATYYVDDTTDPSAFVGYAAQCATSCDGTNDCDLRDAVAAADANSGPDTIKFCNAGTYNLSNLINMSGGNITIDGEDYTMGTTKRVVINGPTSSNCFYITSNNITLTGLAIQDCSMAIYVQGWAPTYTSGIVIQNNYIGTDAAGSTAVANTTGVYFTGAIASTIKDNLISGNTNTGIYVSGATGPSGNQVSGNLIGLTASGSAFPTKSQYGIQLTGGTSGTTVEGNTIVNNSFDGIRIVNATSNTIIGNSIGVGPDGTTPMGNGDNGIFIMGASSNIIGGDTPAAQNIIPYNGNAAQEYGINIYLGTTGNAVLGNRVFNNFAGEIAVATDATATPNPVTFSSGSATGEIIATATMASSGTYTLYFYEDNDNDSKCELINYLGKATGTGTTFTLATTNLAIGTKVVATAKNAASNTSQISNCLAPASSVGDLAPQLTAIGNKSGSEGSPFSFTATSTEPNAADAPAIYGCVENPSTTLTNPCQYLNTSTGAYNWTPSYNEFGSYVMTFSAKDASNPALTTSEQITLTISDTNTTPALTSPGNKTVTEAATLTFALSGSDADGDSLTYTCFQNCPSGLTVDSGTKIVEWTPTYVQAGIYSNVTFRAADSQNNAAIQIITITVNNTDTTPTLTNPGPQLGDETNMMTFTLSGSDVDGDTVTYSCLDNCPTGLFVNGTNGEVTWTPGYGQSGIYDNVTFKAFDPQLNSATQIIAITVDDTDALPTLANPGPQTVDEGGLLEFTIVGNDSDGDKLTYSCTAGCPDGLSVDGPSGLVRWSPTFTQAGSYPSVMLRAVDPQSNSASETITITVNNISEDNYPDFTTRAIAAETSTSGPSETTTQTEAPTIIGDDSGSESTAQTGSGPVNLETTFASGSQGTLNPGGIGGEGWMYEWVIVTGVGNLVDDTSPTPTFIAPSASNSSNTQIMVTATSPGGTIQTETFTVNIIGQMKLADAACSSNLVGFAKSTPVYESEGYLKFGQKTIALPEEKEAYTFTTTDDGHLLIGTPYVKNGTGSVYYFHKTIEELPAFIDLEEDQDKDLFTVAAGIKEGDLLGKYISMGHFSEDDNEEILVGAPGGGSDGHGMVYIYDSHFRPTGTVAGDEGHPAGSIMVGRFLSKDKDDILFGADNSALNTNLTQSGDFDGIIPTNTPFFLAGFPESTDDIGVSISSADLLFDQREAYISNAMGDLNGDGADDLVLTTSAGTAHVFFGGDVSPYTADATISGASASDGFGQSIGIGDFSGDGIPDLIIGAPLAEDGKGALYIIYGSKAWEEIIDIHSSPNVTTLAGEKSGDKWGFDFVIADIENSGDSKIYAAKGTNSVCTIEIPSFESAGGFDVSYDVGGGGGCQLNPNQNRGFEMGLILLLFLSLMVLRKLS